VVDRPIGRDPRRLQPRISLKQVADPGIGIGDMVDADIAASSAAARVHHVEIGEGETVMLVVIGHEGQRGIAVHDPRLEDILIPGDHLVIAPRLIDDMRELYWSCHGAGPPMATRIEAPPVSYSPVAKVQWGWRRLRARRGAGMIGGCVFFLPARA